MGYGGAVERVGSWGCYGSHPARQGAGRGGEVGGRIVFYGELSSGIRRSRRVGGKGSAMNLGVLLVLRWECEGLELKFWVTYIP